MTKEITLSNIHCIDEWEMNKPTSYEFQHVYFFHNSRYVKKVVGRVEVVKKSYNMGSLNNHKSYKMVRWDFVGRCYTGNDNRRNRDYDIHF